ncbi:MAG TPA: cation:proton antiporter [Candidatus Polarisedimenticolia bacterium]|jgi:CPA2 family monovalent cation:H+ antiporter-2
MQGLDLLRDLVVIFGVSVLVVLLLHRLRLPTITGFLVAGMLLGPHGLSLISDLKRIEVLADAGVVLLLFTVGIEFSLATLRRLWGSALAGGLVPLGVTVALGAGIVPLAGGWLLPGGGGMSVGQGIFLGFLVSLSSTVIPLKALADRGQIDSPHGRATIGVAVLQDLMVIPMMLLVPHLGPGSASGGMMGLVSPALALVQAAAVVAGILVVALWAVPRLLLLLASLKSREVFVISIFCVCLGTAWATSSMGLSLALGAFLAGLAVSESEFGHQALADVVPFRDSLNCLFFVSIGMLMDPGFALRMPLAVAGWAGAIIVFKLALIGGALLIAGQRPTVALQAGLALCQVGEFAFVLMRFASGSHLLPDAPGQVFLTASVATMIVTPLLYAGSSPILAIARRWEDKGWWRPAKDLREPPDRIEALSDHVVIVGYGFNGRNLARVLGEIGIQHVVLEMNPETVRSARREGEPILYGDASSPGILERLGAARARVLVLAISDPVSTRRAVAVARRSFPALHIVVRTRYLTEVDELYRLGAEVVIPEEVETSMEIFSRVLQQYGVPPEILVKHARRIRTERYGVFISERPAAAGDAEPGSLPKLAPLIAHAQVQVCTIPSDSAAVGKELGEVDLPGTTGAAVLALMRGREIIPGPSPRTLLAAEDLLVLAGTPEQIGPAVDALAATAPPAG